MKHAHKVSPSIFMSFRVPHGAAVPLKEHSAHRQSNARPAEPGEPSAQAYTHVFASCSLGKRNEKQKSAAVLWISGF